MKVTVKLEGGLDLQAALLEMKTATAKAVTRRAATNALKPMLATAQQLVPVHEGKLRKSLLIGTTLNRRQRTEAKREGPSDVTVSMGTNSRNAVPREFGSSRSAAEPFLRPAYDRHVEGAVTAIEGELWSEIERTAARAARKTARLAATGL